jgi:hypothetical protein
MNSLLKTTNQGATANATGKDLENFVENSLVQYGYKKIEENKKDVFAQRAQKQWNKVFTREAPVGVDIWNRFRRCDFFVLNSTSFVEGIVIECKWQQVAGTTEQKINHLVDTIKHSGLPSIIVIDGEGWSKGVIPWLTQQQQTHPNILGVWSKKEFLSQLNLGFFG